MPAAVPQRVSPQDEAWCRAWPDWSGKPWGGGPGPLESVLMWRQGWGAWLGCFSPSVALRATYGGRKEPSVFRQLAGPWMPPDHSFHSCSWAPTGPGCAREPAASLWPVCTCGAVQVHWAEKGPRALTEGAVLSNPFLRPSDSMAPNPPDGCLVYAPHPRKKQV